MPTALITGITGQDGLYLAELLLAKGYDVHGVIRGQNNPRRELVERLVPDVRLHNGDLTDLSSLMRALRDSEPDDHRCAPPCQHKSEPDVCRCCGSFSLLLSTLPRAPPHPAPAR